MIVFFWQHRFGAPPPPPQTQHAGFRSVPGKWVGGFGAPTAAVTKVAGVRSIAGKWVGGFGAPPAAPPPSTTAGVRSIFGRWVGGFGSTGSATPVVRKHVGWIPERFRHDPEELERRLREQRGFSPDWFGRFLKAQEKALQRAAKTKSEKHRLALIDASERLYTAVDIGFVSLEEAATVLHAAASARRLTASLKACERAMIIADYDEEEEIIEMLLLQ